MQEWEYCALWLHRCKVHKGVLGLGETRFSYELAIRYLRPSGRIYQQLAEVDNVAPDSPFHRTMASLGLGGWELVSLQHGNAFGGSGSHGEYALLEDNSFAYFKRPVVSGRAVDEPALTKATLWESPRQDE